MLEDGAVVVSVGAGSGGTDMAGVELARGDWANAGRLVASMATSSARISKARGMLPIFLLISI
jgi:hypothetical protein